MNLSPAETENLKKAFENPEFRKLFSEYADELQDPKNREENELYIRQLELDEQIPEGKTVIHPKAEFVIKTHKITPHSNTNSKSNDENEDNLEKLFINIVSSDIIQRPIETKTTGGSNWSIPYSIGPPHMEKDNKEMNVTCFDCCFHPYTIELSNTYIAFQNLVIKTALEGVESAYKQSQQITVTLDYTQARILKGVSYKSGDVMTMMIKKQDSENKWKSTTTIGTTTATTIANKSTSDVLKNINTTIISSTNNNSSNNSNTDNNVSVTNSTKKTSSSSSNNSGGLFKKGFLTSPKSNKTSTNISMENMKNVTSNQSSTQSNIVNDNSKSTTTTNNNNSSNTDKVDNSKSMSTIPSQTDFDKSKPIRVHETQSIGNTLIKDIKLPNTKEIQSTPPIIQEINQNTLNIDNNTPSMPSNSHKSQTLSDTIKNSSHKLSIVYTMIERGNINIGDFSQQQSTSARGTSTSLQPISTRPQDIIYKFQVPFVTKPLLLVLDVNITTIKLSYENTYEQIIQLPYPIYEKKGNAKYDKKAKILTVTLPVQPLKAEQIEVYGSTSTNDDILILNTDQMNVNTSESLIQDSTGNNSSGNIDTISKSSTNITSKNTGVDHTRWINQVEKDIEIEKSSILKQDIQSQLSKKQIVSNSKTNNNNNNETNNSNSTSITTTTTTDYFQRKTRSQSKVTHNSSNITSDSSFPSDSPSNNISNLSKTFIACPQFIGQKLGYIFQTNDLGTGYYQDWRCIDIACSSSHNHSNDHTKSNIDNSSSTLLPSSHIYTQYQSFLYQCKETSHSIAMIIQIPHILPITVSIIRTLDRYTSHQYLHIVFQAQSLSSDHKITTTTTATTTTTTDSRLVNNDSKENSSVSRIHNSITYGMSFLLLYTTNSVKGTTTNTHGNADSQNNDNQNNNNTTTPQQSNQQQSDIRKEGYKVIYDVANKNMAILIFKDYNHDLSNGTSSSSDSHEVSSMYLSTETNSAPVPVSYIQSTEQEIVTTYPLYTLQELKHHDIIYHTDDLDIINTTEININDSTNPHIKSNENNDISRVFNAAVSKLLRITQENPLSTILATKYDDNTVSTPHHIRNNFNSDTINMNGNTYINSNISHNGHSKDKIDKEDPMDELVNDINTLKLQSVNDSLFELY